MLPSCHLAPCRFQTTFLGSRAIAGDLVGSGLLNSEDQNGVSVREALGLTTKTQSTLSRLAYKAEQVKGYALYSFVGSPHIVSHLLIVTVSFMWIGCTAYFGVGEAAFN